MRMQPAPGSYRLTPDEKYHRGPYDLLVGAASCEYLAWGIPCPWNPTFQEFRRVAESGWQYGWVCFGGHYTHFAIDPAPLPGAPVITILDTGTCEEV